MNKTFLMKLPNLGKIYEKILDVIFPLSCPICGKEAEIGSLCEACAKTYINGGKSGIFQIEFGGKDLEVFAVDIFYKETKRLIHDLKYNSIKKYATDIFRLGITRFYGELSKADFLTYIPLHPLRFLRRGYNQAEILAKVAATELDIPCKRILFRKRYNITQTKKNIQKRRDSVKNLFALLKNAEIKDKTIILIDDVCTTGSTIGECARILYEAGAKRVIVLVLIKA